MGATIANYNKIKIVAAYHKILGVVKCSNIIAVKRHQQPEYRER
jgi:hypothetical protein